jgi:histone H3
MTHVRFTPEALQALQEASEYFLVKAFEHSCRVTAIAKRKTCFPEDLQMGIDLRDRAL